MAAEPWELRTARLEGACEQIDRCLSAVASHLSTLEQKVGTGFAQVRADLHAEIHGEVGGLRNELRHQFYWLMGALGTVLALMVSGFLQLALKLGGH